MGKRGPLPLPTWLLEGHGSWRAKINRSEPMPSSQRPSCPRWLDRDARRMWYKLTNFMAACRHLTLLDGPLLSRYCQAWSYWKRAEEFLQRHGETYPVKGAPGQGPLLLPWPHVAHALRLSSELSRIEKQLGLHPGFRCQLRVRARPDTQYAHPTEFERWTEGGGVEAARKRRQRQLRRQRARRAVIGPN